MSVPTPPQGADLTLPAHFVLFASGTANAAEAAGSADAAAGHVTLFPLPSGAPSADGAQANVTDSGEGIEVSVLQTGDGDGSVSVTVPRNVIASGRGFSFALPKELRTAAAGGTVQVTTGGERLPSWLRYDEPTRTFSASVIPAGALPMQLQIRIGARRWTMTIAPR
jgi:hypothetical protein